MKRPISTTIALLLLAFLSTLQAQDATSIEDIVAKSNTKTGNCTTCNDNSNLVYDFKCKNFWIKTGNGYNRVNNLSQVTTNYNQPFKIQVINLNRYLYDVDIKTEQVDFGSETPALFNQLFIGGSGTIDKLLGSLSNTFNVQSANSSNVAAIESFKAVPDTVMQVNPVTLEEERVLVQPDPLAVALAAYYANLKNFKNEYYKLLDNEITTNSACPSTQFKCCGDLTPITFSEYSQLLDALTANYTTVQGALAQIINNKPTLEASKKEIETEKKDVEQKQKTLDELKAKLALDPKNKELQKQVADQQKLVEACRPIKVIKSELTDVNQQIDQANNYAGQKPQIEEQWKNLNAFTEQQLMRLILIHNNMLTQHLSYTSPPIYPQGNYLSLDMSVTGNDSSLAAKWGTMPLDNDEIHLDLFVRWKPYVHFSSGLFAGFGNKLKSDIYSWQPQYDPSTNVMPDSTGSLLVENGRSIPPIGFAAFANIGTKVAPWFGFGGSIGVGVSIEKKPRPVYMAGLSAYFGDKQQFNLTLGAALSTVNKLNTSVYKDLDKVVYASTKDIDYNQKLAVGGFVSLTYTFYTIGNRVGLRSGSKKRGNTLSTPAKPAPAAAPAEEKPKTEETKK